MTFNFNKSMSISMVAGAMILASCGAMTGKKKSSKQDSAPETRITEVKAQGRKFVILYASDKADATFKCKSDSMNDWVDCPTNGYQYELPAGVGSESFSVKAVSGGKADETPAAQRLTGQELASGSNNLGSAPGATSAIQKFGATILEKGRIASALTNNKLRVSFGLKSGSAQNVKFECKENGALAFAPCSEPAAHTISNLKKGSQVSLTVRPVSLTNNEVGDSDSLNLRIDQGSSGIIAEELLPAGGAVVQQGGGIVTGSSSSDVRFFGSPLKIGDYQFGIQQNFDVVQYTTNRTVNAFLDADTLIDGESTFCDGTMINRGISQDRILPYCRRHLPSGPQAVEWLRSEGLTPNSLVVQTPGNALNGDFERISLSFYDDSRSEYANYTHAFEFYCGAKTGDQSSVGMIGNVPLINNYWHGVNPGVVNFRYCTREIVVDTQLVNVMIGTFVNQENQVCSPFGHALEVVYMATINQSNFNPNMFARKAQERILPTLTKTATVSSAPLIGR